MDVYDQLWKLYEDDLCLLRNPVCNACDAKVRAPVAVWHVGASFEESKPRVLFIGKPHRGWPGHVRPSGIIDPRALVDKDLRHRSWPYWRYTIDIADLIHGPSQGWHKIAMTNIVKCTNVNGEDGSQDTTTATIMQKCVLDLRVIDHEIEILQPSHIIMYTARLYPNTISAAKLGASTPWRDIARGTKPCGRKHLAWWERIAESSWGSLKMLITGHPERMSRRDFTLLVADWIRSV
jgi:hypothetical protein